MTARPRSSSASPASTTAVHGIVRQHDFKTLLAQGREVDFVMARRRDEVDVIECKWSSAAFDSAALEVFRSHYPKGRNYLVSPSGAPGYTKQFGSHEVRVCTPSEFPVLPLS